MMLSLLPVTALAASADAGLTTVLGETIAAGVQAGTTAAPKEATINVANTVATVSSSEIVAAATITFYGTDSNFTTEDMDGVALTAGTSETVYIKVVVEDTTALHYKVAITVAAATPAGYAVTITVNNDEHGPATARPLPCNRTPILPSAI